MNDMGWKKVQHAKSESYILKQYDNVIKAYGKLEHSEFQQVLLDLQYQAIDVNLWCTQSTKHYHNINSAAHSFGSPPLPVPKNRHSLHPSSCLEIRQDTFNKCKRHSYGGNNDTISLQGGIQRRYSQHSPPEFVDNFMSTGISNPDLKMSSSSRKHSACEYSESYNRKSQNSLASYHNKGMHQT